MQWVKKQKQKHTHTQHKNKQNPVRLLPYCQNLTRNHIYIYEQPQHQSDKWQKEKPAALWLCLWGPAENCTQQYIVYTDYASKFTSSWKIINIFVKRKILFIALDYSKCIHMHPPPHTHTQHRGTPTHKHSNYIKLNLHSSKQWLEMDEDSSMEQKTWQVYSFGKINVFTVLGCFWISPEAKRVSVGEEGHSM